MLTCKACTAKDSEITFLREQLATLQGQLIRVHRVEAGLPEVAPEPRKPIPPIPHELETMIREGFDSEAFREDLRTRAKRSYAKHKNWDEAIELTRMALEAE
jgi:hypothetical protein